MNEQYRYPIAGETVRIGTPTGNNFGTELSYENHTVVSVEPNPYNSIVPFSFMTCCGKYVPTSACDGHWENSMHTGSWENTPTPITEDNLK